MIDHHQQTQLFITAVHCTIQWQPLLNTISNQNHCKQWQNSITIGEKQWQPLQTNNHHKPLPLLPPSTSTMVNHHWQWLQSTTNINNDQHNVHQVSYDCAWHYQHEYRRNYLTFLLSRWPFHVRKSIGAHVTCSWCYLQKNHHNKPLLPPSTSTIMNQHWHWLQSTTNHINNDQQNVHQVSYCCAPCHNQHAYIRNYLTFLLWRRPLCINK